MLISSLNTKTDKLDPLLDIKKIVLYKVYMTLYKKLSKNVYSLQLKIYDSEDFSQTDVSKTKHKWTMLHKNYW